MVLFDITLTFTGVLKGSVTDPRELCATDAFPTNGEGSPVECKNLFKLRQFI